MTFDGGLQHHENQQNQFLMMKVSLTALETVGSLARDTSLRDRRSLQVMSPPSLELTLGFVGGTGSSTSAGLCAGSTGLPAGPRSGADGAGLRDWRHTRRHVQM